VSSDLENGEGGYVVAHPAPTHLLSGKPFFYNMQPVMVEITPEQKKKEKRRIVFDGRRKQKTVSIQQLTMA
jgi:hypothetical protein